MHSGTLIFHKVLELQSLNFEVSCEGGQKVLILNEYCRLVDEATLYRT
jgi:hypothetical protein